MKLHSMTGYALARRDTAAGTVFLELRSVNSRFLDPQFRISDELRAAEGVLREAITARLSRGKLDCRFYIHRGSQNEAALQLNGALAQQLRELDAQVRRLLPDAEPLSVAEVLRWPGALEEAALNGEEVLVLAQDLVREALDALTLSRSREGEKLKQILFERIDSMEAIAARLTPLVPQLVAAHQQKLTERLTQALAGSGTGEGQTGSPVSREEALDRIRQEVTLYGVRIDVAEELARLSAHLAETRHILDAGGPTGKRLDFMMQELNREANTLGSKSAAAELADAAMELKLLIEQMREQVQNIE